LQRGFRQAHLEKVRFEETMMNSFEYSGEITPNTEAQRNTEENREEFS